MGELVDVIGAIDRVVFKSPENGFVVVSVKISSKESIVARGYLPDLHPGTQVCLKGTWQFHQKFGRQFAIESYETQLPASAVGIEKYLSSGLIKGIGPKFAQKLVEKFGEKTLEVIDKTPAQLFEVDGVGPKRVQLITQAWQDQKEISRVMVFLKAKDVSTAYAVKIYKTYGNEALDKIQENPYRLIDDIWGIGFKSADKIALKLGLAQNSLERVKAAIQFVLSDITNEGHLYLEVQVTKDRVTELLNLEHLESGELLKQALHLLYQEEKIKLLTVGEKHFLTLPQFYFSEIGIARRAQYLLDRSVSADWFDVATIYKTVAKPDARGLELNEDQQRGIMACLQRKITVITGGPGTGKTTLIKRLIEVLEENKIRFRLAAPTGRAAKRMFESTGRNTETLHRLLEFSPATMGFTRNEQNALDLDFLIIDEMSMVDVFLMHAVLKALKATVHLVLIGDVDQLPSVGAGNVLKDFIASGKVEVVRLTQIFRQAQDSMIIVNAHRVNNGEFPTSAPSGSKRDYFFIKEDVPENTFAWLRDIYSKKLPAAGISHEDAIVLVPMNRGVVGTQRINQELQLMLNPGQEDQKQVMHFGQVYKVGDRVMQIRNNYEKFVFNGDIGKIVAINTEEQVLRINFGERELEYDFTELNELVLSYAISIHKSQGSEFKAVIIPIFMQHFILLQRNLIYTAITRAKKLCIIIGQPKAIAMGIKNDKGLERVTFLKEFLTSDLQAR